MIWTIGVVLYNPTDENIAHCFALAELNAFLVLILNGPIHRSEIIQNLKAKKNIFIIENSQNIGIAAAINQIIIHFNSDPDNALLLVLDQDTLIGQSFLDESWLIHERLSKTRTEAFILTPTMIDRKCHPTLNALLTETPRASQEFKSIHVAPTSGTIFNQFVINKVGMMREDLFVDGVDYEWCWRAKDKGISIIRSADLRVLHNMGTHAIRLFGFFFPMHDSPQRHYYIVRNSIFLSLFSKTSIYQRLRLLRSAIFRIPFYIFYSKNRLKSVRLIILGAVHGARGILGPLQVT